MKPYNQYYCKLKLTREGLVGITQSKSCEESKNDLLMLYHPLLLSPVQEDDTEHDEELEETCPELHQSTGIPHNETVE